MLVVSSATGPSKPCSIGSSKNTTRRSLAIWRSRAELPEYMRREFEDYLKCGRLEHGFLRVQYEACHTEHLVAFSCKCRGFYPRCGARRMAESAALLFDEVLPEQPMRRWVLSFPFPLRFLFASRPEIMVQVLGIVYRVIATHLEKLTWRNRWSYKLT